MLKLIICTDEYKLHSDFRRQKKLKAELLSRYRDEDEVVVYDKDKEIYRCELSVIFEK